MSNTYAIVRKAYDEDKEKLRKIVYGGIKTNEVTAMSNFIDSRMFKEKIITELIPTYKKEISYSNYKGGVNNLQTVTVTRDGIYHERTFTSVIGLAEAKADRFIRRIINN